MVLTGKQDFLVLKKKTFSVKILYNNYNNYFYIYIKIFRSYEFETSKHFLEILILYLHANETVYKQAISNLLI